MKLILFLALSVCAYADTVTITSSGAFYNAMLNSSTSIRMLCVEVHAPAPISPYEATVSRFDNLSATRHPEQAQAFTAAAWLYDQMVLNMASPQNLFPIQQAIWGLLTPGYDASNPWITKALSASVGYDVSGFVIITPTTSPTQEMIARLNTAPVPEPNCLVLLGSGLAGLAALLKKRK